LAALQHYNLYILQALHQTGERGALAALQKRSPNWCTSPVLNRPRALRKMSAMTAPTPGAAPSAPPPRWTCRSCNYDHTSSTEVKMTVCAACLTPKARVSFSDVQTIDVVAPANKWPDGERRGMRVKIARDDVDWSKVEKRPENDPEHVLGVALDYDGRAYEVRVLDAYTAWLPRYRFSVVSDS